MSNVKVEVSFNQQALLNLTAGSARTAALHGAEAARRYARDVIMAEGRIDTGEMLENIEIESLENGPNVYSFTVTAVAPHAWFNEVGTKAHGPKRAKVMRFTPKGGSGFVYAQWVRGISGIHFMERAVRSLTVDDFTS